MAKTTATPTIWAATLKLAFAPTPLSVSAMMPRSLDNYSCLVYHNVDNNQESSWFVLFCSNISDAMQLTTKSSSVLIGKCQSYEFPVSNKII